MVIIIDISTYKLSYAIELNEYCFNPLHKTSCLEPIRTDKCLGLMVARNHFRIQEKNSLHSYVCSEFKSFITLN